jgi:hypothetical protein
MTRIAAGMAIAITGILCAAAPARAERPPDGRLRILVFIGPTPAEGVRVEVPGAAALDTTADGSVAFTLPPGEVRARLSIPRAALRGLPPGGTPLSLHLDGVEVVEGEEVEALVTLDHRGVVLALDVETARLRGEERRRRQDFERQQATAPKGMVRGTVTSAAGEAVAGAQVFIRGAPLETTTGDDGAFQLELPQGKYDLTVIHPRHVTINVKDVEVVPGAPRVLALRAEAVSAQLEDFVVTAPHIEGGVAALVTERRESASVDEVIGVEEMSRSGDSDAASALRRVTGITVIGGQYVYVRGMGERYSATLLNGQAIPSPEPERRVIPLDLFSTDVLESIVIQKTASPDIPAELGGGVVLLRTRGFPEELTLSAELSTALATNATFKSRPSYRGGGLDFLGIDDGTRDLPGAIRDAGELKEATRFEDGYSREELAAFGRMLPVNYDVRDETVPLNAGASFTIGDQVDLGRVPSGFLLSLSWGQAYNFQERISRRYVSSATAPDGLELNNDFLIQETARSVGVSGIFATGLKPAKNHDVRLTTLLLRVTDDEAAVVTGRSNDLGVDIRQSRLRFVERQLFTQQITGEHELVALGKAKVEYRYAFSQANRDEPDRREYYYADEAQSPPADYQINGRPGGNGRTWSELTDRVHDVGFDYTQPFRVWAGLEAKVKGGGTLLVRDREYQTLRFTLDAPNLLTPEERRQAPNEVWSLENINATDGWILEDNTQPTDFYSAEQRLQAGYLMTTVPITDTLELTGGARLEHSRQRVVTFSPFEATPVQVVTELDDTDLFPSATLKWQVTDALVIRGGYGRTVTRPDFREISTSGFRDVTTGIRYVGNAELERGTIDHLDARAEYYWAPDEVVSIAGFYKRFQSPIEQVDLGTVDRTVSWDNAESANNFGVEIEGRRRFGFLSRRLENVFVAGNLAFIRSQVNLGDQAGISTSKERALQGQSPYVLNLQLGYDDASGSGIQLVALYNVSGRRIRDVGRAGSPDIFEQPFHLLDLVYSQKLPGGFTVKLKASNLLGDEVEFLQGPNVVSGYDPGRTFSLSLSWSH